MNPVMAGCVVVTALVVYLALALQPVTVDIYPHVAIEPADVRISVRVRPNPENRGLYVEADGSMYRASFIQLDGDEAPISYQINWPAFSAGEYTIRASVSSNVRVLARDTTTLKVLGRGE